MKKSYIIVHETKGIFNDLAIMHGTNKKFEIFAKDDENQYSLGYAKTFSSEIEAVDYINYVFTPEFSTKLKVVKLDGYYANDVTYIDLLKNGLGEYTGYMMNSLPMDSNSLH
jgi:hypothetical protein